MELVLFIYLLVFEKAVVRLSDCVARTNFSQAAGTEPLKAESMGSSSNNCLTNAFWQMASERIKLKWQWRKEISKTLGRPSKDCGGKSGRFYSMCSSCCKFWLIGILFWFHFWAAYIFVLSL